MAVFKSRAVTKDGRKWYYSVCYTNAKGEKDRKKGHKYASKLEAHEAERQFLADAKQNRI